VKPKELDGIRGPPLTGESRKIEKTTQNEEGVEARGGCRGYPPPVFLKKRLEAIDSKG
jgi:hypothetical protein